MIAIKSEAEVLITPEEDYRAFLRSIRRRRGFGLLFVQCSAVGAVELVQKVKTDIPNKQFGFLELDASTDDLFTLVEAYAENHPGIDALFIRGLEYSIFEYEDREFGNILERSKSEVYGGRWAGVPRLFGHLNLSRERFRDHFNFCIVFLVPEFVMRYFARRAPDFFDWRSNVFNYPINTKLEQQQVSRLLGGDFYTYQPWTPEQRLARLVDIRASLSESLPVELQSDLYIEQCLIYLADENYKRAIQSADAAIALNLHISQSWLFRAYGLVNLGRNEEAIASFDRALAIKSDNYAAWLLRGLTLSNLGRNEEAVASYDRAVEIKPDYREAWYGRGYSLGNLGRYEEAIASYNKALEIKPDYHNAWNGRGYNLNNLGRYEEAIASYDRALEVKPDLHQPWNNRGIALGKLGKYEEAIASYDRALEVKPDYHEAWNNRGVAFVNIGRYEEAIASYNRAMEINPDNNEVRNNICIAQTKKETIAPKLEIIPPKKGGINILQFFINAFVLGLGIVVVFIVLGGLAYIFIRIP